MYLNQVWTKGKHPYASKDADIYFFIMSSNSIATYWQPNDTNPHTQILELK